MSGAKGDFHVGRDLTIGNPLPITQGGQGASTAAGARSNLGIAVLDSGIYTPTLSNPTNLDSQSVQDAQYSRVGDTVTVSGRIDYNPTTLSTYTAVRMSLPIAPTTFTGTRQAGGTGASLKDTFRIGAVTSTVLVLFETETITNNGNAMFFSFTYRL